MTQASTGIQSLVVNGCSYNEIWSKGPGPWTIAKSFGLRSIYFLSRGGSCNSRILRTTLKHSYQTQYPTLYLVGLTFLSRWELPIVEADHTREFEGRWINPQAQGKEPLQLYWTEQDTKTYTELSFKSVTWAIPDLLEDLMFRCVAAAADLNARGHNVVFWNNCDLAIPKVTKDSARFDLLKSNAHFVDALNWAAVPWQHEQGAEAIEYESKHNMPPPNLRHIKSSCFQHLNSYLTTWIRDNKILP